MTLGKNKGSEFERVVCKKLSLLISKGQRTDLLWRSAMSGGRATIQFNKGESNKTQTGDISAIAAEGAFLVEKYLFELKFYKDLNIAQSVIRNYGNLHSFWIRLRRDANNFDKAPCLIAKQNHFPIIVITEIGKPLSLNQRMVPPIITIHKWKAEVSFFDDVMSLHIPRKRVRIEDDEIVEEFIDAD